MDKAKTGALIAAARREKNMTQRELAAALHVSDRAVSKWERGAGFPHISLLEPLADALGLGVLDLLRGERGTDEKNAEAAVSEVLQAVREERRRRRKETWSEAAKALPLLCILWCVMGAFGMLRLPVDKTVTAGVYQVGEQIALTEVHVDGWMTCGVIPWDLEYQGKLITSLSETSDRIRFSIPLTAGEAHARHRSWSGNITSDEGPFIGNQFYLTPTMGKFAFCLTDGSILATSWEAYQEYIERYGGIPLIVL